jgi:hypothetical protein
MLEEIVDRRRASPELEATRREARSHFFGDEDERPVEYWPGTGNLVSKERRFLGYFLFVAAGLRIGHPLTSDRELRRLPSHRYRDW